MVEEYNSLRGVRSFKAIETFYLICKEENNWEVKWKLFLSFHVNFLFFLLIAYS